MAPITDWIINPTSPSANMPTRPRRNPPRKAPITPMIKSPIKPNPRPRIKRLASHPDTKPTIRKTTIFIITSKFSPACGAADVEKKDVETKKR